MHCKEKECSICETMLPFGEFYAMRKGRDTEPKLRPECKRCFNATTRRGIKKYKWGVERFILKQRFYNRLRYEIGRCSYAEAEAYLGCTWSEMTEHLMKHLPPGEKLANMDVDHVNECRHWDLVRDVESRYHIFNWRNLRLLSKPVHRAKTNLEQASVASQSTPPTHEQASSDNTNPVGGSTPDIRIYLTGCNPSIIHCEAGEIQ